jgi:hypothetical protein
MGKFPFRIDYIIPLVVGVMLSGQASAIDPEAPYHEQILQALTEEPTRDQVIPWRPDAALPDVVITSNREAPVPPQCYTDISEGMGTEGMHNPCYVCHQNEIAGRENKQNDRDLQEAYSFSDAGLTNHWFNLFEDRSARVAAISDAEILDWIDDDNYSELAGRLQAAGWGNDDFPGWDTADPAIYGEPWLPDLANLQEGAVAFDEHGLALDGSWWVAYNYKPLPSTFWPTNGLTDDVMIRLAPGFFKTLVGVVSLDVYRANLALVEANIKGVDRMDSLPTNEVAIGEDVNDDDVLETEVTEVVVTTNRKFTVEGERNFYVGQAGQTEYIEPSIYPLGTEFLHTVRYVGVDDEGNIYNSRRMKEVRYMRRFQRGRLFDQALLYEEELLEKEDGALPTFLNHGHSGLAKKFGWQITGFLEAYDGRLRWNTYEENSFCMGCHSSIGSTIDKTFSFARKVDGAAGWGYINLKGMKDAPNVGETRGEIATYLPRVGGGTEFRSNPELEARFYHPNGDVSTVALASARDVYDVITPSRDRALALNKAYKVIVEDQDFIYGRDATAMPPPRVLSEVDNETSPTLPEERQFDWNIVQDWAQVADDECFYAGDVDFAQLTEAHAVSLGGTGPGEHGQVCAGGTVTLTGDVNVVLEDGYEPEVGDSYEIVKAGSLQGGFDNVNFPALSSGRFFKVIPSATSLTVLVTVDTDLDGVSDDVDNCIDVPNGSAIPDAGGNSQRDTDGDGFGNVCDADLNNDGQVDAADIALFRSALFSNDADADLNGDGSVDAADVAILRNLLSRDRDHQRSTFRFQRRRGRQGQHTGKAERRGVHTPDRGPFRPFPNRRAGLRDRW